MEKFTPEFLAGIISVVLTLLFAYFPTLRVKFAALSSEVKSAIMLGMYAVFTTLVYVLAFYKLIPVEAPLNFYDVIMVFFTMVITGQPTYTVLPEAKDVKEAKALR